ncbi:hypothetical protein KBB96_03920 [Luteolibacter ambystomatis]|uniref:DoxX family protein n=1 Tax=Luteolibacter ambystomatis TaxID=2824561 RepID=A0A975J105_9BACT|nr:hypothetical protein [Luteolibacter ambystomatis]QUE52040.1 hypothetical protein KBB96_03920 [Luteolibacter ambystomatis]
MKHIPNIVGGLLGLMFVAFGLMVLLHLGPTPPAPPEGSPPALFMGALMPTGYMTFVKVLEVAGGLLVAIPKTRNFGLLVLGPIIVNILAFHIFILKGAMIFDPVLITVCVFAAYLLWDGRKAFCGLLR